MNMQEAAIYINSNPQQFLVPDKYHGYVCPICGSGSGRNGTGISENKRCLGRFTCWAGNCFNNATVVDILALKAGVTDISSANFRQVIRVAAQEAHISLDSSSECHYKHRKKANFPHSTQNMRENTPLLSSKYIATCRGNMQQCDYLSKMRCISEETIARFPIGYDEHFPAGGGTFWKAIIFFTSDSTWEARNTDRLATEANRHRKSKGNHSQQIFNREALIGDEPVFLVESIIDALSIIDVGGQAVSAGGTSGLNLLLKAAKNGEITAPRLIVAYDNDKDSGQAGQKANAKALSEFNKIGYPCELGNIYGDAKDANEALCKDRESFRVSVQYAISQAKLHAETALAEEQEEYLQTCAAAMVGGFANEIERQQGYYATGFAPLDRVLDGGFYAGIYTIGAISSLGKTTFCLQVADNIAKQGGDVLIFSLEMSKYELMAKSVSRITYEISQDSDIYAPATTRDILSNRYRCYEPRREAVLEALFRYGEYADHIFIKEGIGNVGVAEIREAVRLHIRKMKRLPVVLVDYLQILAPIEPRMSDKQIIDNNILELKRLSRDENIPIIGISSFNRENYNNPINLTSFKESGAIEYSSDVLLGLQYNGMDYKRDKNGDTESDSERIKRIRNLREEIRERSSCGETLPVELKVLKNRNGSKGRVIFDFLPAYNVFSTSVNAPEVGKKNRDEKLLPNYNRRKSHN